MNGLMKNLSNLLRATNDADLNSICTDRSKLETNVYEILVDCQFSRLESLLDEYSGIDFVIAEIMEKMVKKYGAIINFIFEIGYILSLIRLSEKLAKQKRTDKKILKARSSYRDIILKILYENHEPLMHKDLAKALEISPSNLTNIIQRIEEEEVPLIQTNSLSKYKYYLLTDKGLDYVENHLNNNIFNTYYYQVQINKNNNHSLFMSVNEFLPENRKENNDTDLINYYTLFKICDRQKKSLLPLNKDIKHQYIDEIEKIDKYVAVQTEHERFKNRDDFKKISALLTAQGGK